MQAELIIFKGQVRLSSPVYLKPDAPNHLTVEIKDEYVAASRDWFPEEAELMNSSPPKVPEAKPGSLQEELNSILGPYAQERPCASIGDDHQTLLDAMEERYYGR